jgi:hypothetical protein
LKVVLIACHRKKKTFYTTSSLCENASPPSELAKEGPTRWCTRGEMDCVRALGRARPKVSDSPRTSVLQ